MGNQETSRKSKNFAHIQTELNSHLVRGNLDRGIKWIHKNDGLGLQSKPAIKQSLLSKGEKDNRGSYFSSHHRSKRLQFM